jgi:hypothetical protein
MTRRFPGLVLVLALSAAPAFAQTTTSTTTPGGRCVRGNPTLCPIDIRLEAFQETVRDADLGRLLHTPIFFRLEKSARCLGHATALCDGRLDTDENRARAKLQRCARPLAIVRARIHSRYARRILPPDLFATLASEVDGLASDFEAARTSLTCP